MARGLTVDDNFHDTSVPLVQLDEILPGGYNCEITLSEPKFEVNYDIEYHFVNKPRAGWYDTLRHSYCPNSGVIQRFMEHNITRVVEELRPRYIHFGHDEPCGRTDG